MAITQAVLGKLPEGTHTVEPGLYFRVRGKYRNFFVRLQVDGKRRDVGIGSVNEITLAAAKAKASALRAEALNGHKNWGKKEEARAIPLFGAFAVQALEKLADAKKWKNPRTKRMYDQIMRDYLLPTLKDIPVDEVTRDDVLAVLHPIWDTKVESSKRSRQLLECIFDFAAAEGLTDKRNPATWRGNLELFLPPVDRIHRVKHREAPTLKELQKVAREFVGSRFPLHQATLFGILTASRLNEFIAAKWEEFDFQNRVWLVPPERRKDGKPYPHRVPLSSQSLFLLKGITRKSEYVFQSRYRSDCHINSSQPKQVLQEFLLRKVTMHGCRSTFSDWCVQNGVSEVLSEKSLMHATGNRVRQAYQRDDLLEERRPVMQRWADALFEGVELPDEP